jgi:hypothetical protein
VKNVLVLISGPAHPALNDGAINCAVDVLRAQGATVGAPDWLATDVACDIPFDMPSGGPSSGVTMTALDGVVVAAAGRRKKLLLADKNRPVENEMRGWPSSQPRKNRRHHGARHEWRDRLRRRVD